MQPNRRAWIADQLGPEKAATYETTLGPLRWLVDLWDDAGQVRAELGPNGLQLWPLGWPEVVAWVEGAGEHNLAPVFRRGVIALSQAYAQTAMAAVKLSCPAPFDPGKG